MKESLFRKVALDKMASPEQLDQLLTITTPRTWLLLCVMAIFMFVGGVWSWFGTVTTNVGGSGMMVATSGVFNVSHHAEGKLVSIEAHSGDFVSKGETVAFLSQPENEVALRQAREELKNTASQTEYVAKLQQINALEAKLKEAQRITTPVSGKVLEIKAKAGEVIHVGQSIVSINMADKNTEQFHSEMLMFVSAEEGKQVQPGMEVHIMPSFVKKEQYGYMIGKVRTVSELPVTEDGMLRSLGSKELVQKFLGANSTVMEVRVELLKAGTPSGFLWSSKEGPPLQIGDGTIAGAEIVVKKQRPLTLFFIGTEQLLRRIVES